MATIEERTNPSRDLFDKVRALSRYGNNSVFRRVLSVLKEELKLRDAEVDCCRPDRNGGCRPQNLAAMDFNALMREVRQDDRRRSVFLDPAEALRAHLYDFYSGRLDVLEIRETDSGPEFAALTREVMNRIQQDAPIVTVNHLAGATTEEIVQSLRLLAANLESGKINAMSGVALRGMIREDNATSNGECRVIGTRLISRDWTEGGKRLVAVYETETECISIDKCCGNQVITRQTSRSSRDEWADTNQPSNPPPTGQYPPPFEQQPWSNQLPLLSDTSGSFLSSDFGWRQLCDPTCRADFHGGIDVAAPVGRGVNAAVGGEIVFTDNSSWERSQVVIRVGDQLHTYRHIVPSVTSGRVNPGDPIGNIKDGGPPHVHYERNNTTDVNNRTDQNAVNPLP